MDKEIIKREKKDEITKKETKSIKSIKSIKEIKEHPMQEEHTKSQLNSRISNRRFSLNNRNLDFKRMSWDEGDSKTDLYEGPIHNSPHKPEQTIKRRGAKQKLCINLAPLIFSNFVEDSNWNFRRHTKNEQIQQIDDESEPESDSDQELDIEIEYGLDQNVPNVS